MQVDLSRSALAAVAGLAVVGIAVAGGSFLFGSSEAQPCVPAEAVLADSLDTSPVDLSPLGGEPVNSVSWLQGEVPDAYPEEICEKLFLEPADAAGPVVNVSIHRYPSADEAETGFPGFFQAAIDYGDEVSPGHRFDLDNPRRSAHLLPESCLVVTVTWGADSLRSPEERHAAVIDTYSTMTASAC